MIYVVEIPKENEFCSFDRFEHGIESHVWSTDSKQEFVEIVGERTDGSFVTFEDAVNAISIGDGIEKVMIFLTEDEALSALNNSDLWGSGTTVEQDEYSIPTPDELLAQAKNRLAREIKNNMHSTEPLFVEADGEVFFG